MSLLDDDIIENESCIENIRRYELEDLMNLKMEIIRSHDAFAMDKISLWHITDNNIYITPDAETEPTLNYIVLSIPDKQPIMCLYRALEIRKHEINQNVNKTLFYQSYDDLKQCTMNWYIDCLKKNNINNIYYPSCIPYLYYIGPMDNSVPILHADNIKYISNIRVFGDNPKFDLNLLRTQLPSIQAIGKVGFENHFLITDSIKDIPVSEININVIGQRTIGSPPVEGISILKDGKVITYKSNELIFPERHLYFEHHNNLDLLRTAYINFKTNNPCINDIKITTERNSYSLNKYLFLHDYYKI